MIRNIRYNSNIVDKGFYNHPQSNSCIFLKQYIIVREDAKKLLLLRFWNAADFVINGMQIVLTQIGADNQVIDTSVVQMDGMKIGPAETYTTVEGIVISDKCVDFRVFVKCVRSGSYEYYERGGKTVPKYRPQTQRKQRSREFGRAFITKCNTFPDGIAAFVAVLLMMALVMGVYIYVQSL